MWHRFSFMQCNLNAHPNMSLQDIAFGFRNVIEFLSTKIANKIQRFIAVI